MTDRIEDAIRSRAGTDSKTVVGVTGTPLPNKVKEPLLLTFQFDERGQRVVFADQYEETVRRRVTGRPEYEEASVTFHKSGTSSAVPFTQQGVTVTIPGEALPLTETDIDRFKGIIRRSEDGVEIAEVYYDMAGRSDQ